MIIVRGPKEGLLISEVVAFTVIYLLNIWRLNIQKLNKKFRKQNKTPDNLLNVRQELEIDDKKNESRYRSI